MKVDKLFGRCGWRRCLVAAAALGVYAGAGSYGPAGAAGLLHQSLPRGMAAAIPVTWFTDLSAARHADSAKDPCITATGQLRIDDRFLGTASLVLNPREVLTVSHVPAVNGRPHDRFSLLLGYDRGWTAFTAEATVVARGSYRADSSGGSHYRGGDWAIAVLDKPAPAEIVPLAIYQGQPEDLLGKPLWVQGYAMSYASSAAPFVAKDCVQAALLRLAVAERRNVLIAGATSTGKTTLANALLKEIAPTGDRIGLSLPLSPLSPPSFPRKRGSRASGKRQSMWPWIPAFAGMTVES